jgi:hypothetical protein
MRGIRNRRLCEAAKRGVGLQLKIIATLLLASALYAETPKPALHLSPQAVQQDDLRIGGLDPTIRLVEVSSGGIVTVHGPLKDVYEKVWKIAVVGTSKPPHVKRMGISYGVALLTLINNVGIDVLHGRPLYFKEDYK